MEQSNLWRLKVDYWSLWAEQVGKKRGMTANEHEVSLGVIKNIPELIVVVVE